ncbi:MAG: hypothetical protein HYV07_20660 [Deltaproteobacteria bacterium]|nr:hypothetical protein [Deltaproteobacteria bacterium]
MSTALLVSMALSFITADPSSEPVARAPLVPAPQHVTQINLDAYQRTTMVTRERSPGKQFAAFSSDPHLLEPGSVMVFEIRSVAKSGEIVRWRCIAEHDVADCLGGKGVKVRYLPNDERVVLTARLEPRVAMEGALASR